MKCYALEYSPTGKLILPEGAHLNHDGTITCPRGHTHVINAVNPFQVDFTRHDRKRLDDLITNPPEDTGDLMDPIKAEEEDAARARWDATHRHGGFR